MAKGKNAAIGGGIAAAVIIGIIATVLAGSYAPETSDVVLPPSSTEIIITPENESENLQQSGGHNFYIDEDGRKVIVIETGDSLSISD